MFAILLLSASANAADHHVGLGFPHLDVGSAIAAAAAGDRVVVHPGTYGPFTLNKTLEIVGSGGASATVIEARGQQAVRITAGAPVLRGLTLDGSLVDRALEVVGATVTLEDAVLTDGDIGTDGGCGWFDASTVTLRRVTVDDCEAGNEGGGIYARDTQLVLEASTISDNEAEDGNGGGMHVSGGSLTLRGTLVTGNVAEDSSSSTGFGFGGGIYARNSFLRVSGSTFLGNEARSDRADGGIGGGLRSRDSTLVVERSLFQGNIAEERGSAIAIAGASSSVSLTSSRFEANVVDEPQDAATYGGAIMCEESAPCVVERCWFEDNEAVDGAAITSRSSLAVRTSMFCENVAVEDAGAVDLGNLDADQEGSITGSVFSGNLAEVDGGALVFRSRADGFRNNHFINNASQSGGAVLALAESGVPSALTATNNLYVGNTADDAAFVADIAPLLEGWEWFFDNTAAHYSGALAPTSSAGVDPLLVGGASLGSCDVSPLLPGLLSPLRDAGDPALLDRDGTPSDIGAFGGPDGDAGAFLDGDGDGWAAMLDCADTDAARSLDTVEICNQIDDDCDGLVDALDSASGAAWLHPDADGDGLGNPAVSTYLCATSDGGLVADGSDCDDTDSSVGVGTTLWRDRDGDGFGDAASPVTACGPGPGLSVLSTDCDDANALLGEPRSWYFDDDSDGHGVGQAVVACAPPGPDWTIDLGNDCDDTNPQTFPGAPEQCNLIDDDCDGAIDDDVVQIEWWPDADIDGYGSPNATPVLDCIAPGPDWASRSGDCDDANASINPGEREICGGGDEDCDRLVDIEDDSLDPASLRSFYPDSDGDGHGEQGALPTIACEGKDGMVDNATDCDDTDASIHPGVVETPYDGIDQDCDGLDAEIPVDQDSDNDGMTDLVEASVGADPLDPDSDDDGWLDGEEGPVDTDGDGLADPIDPDDDGDGLPTAQEERGDADKDERPNHLDPDSDNDGVIDGADAAPLDPGGRIRRSPEPQPGFTCTTAPRPGQGAGRPGLALGALLAISALRRRASTSARQGDRQAR